MLDQRFPVQLPDCKTINEERFIKIVKKNFPDRLKQRLLHANMNIPFRSHESYPHSIHEELDGLRMRGGILKGNSKQLAMRQPHQLKRSDLQTSKSEPNFSQRNSTSDVAVSVLPRIEAKSSLSHMSNSDSESDILDAIVRERTFYPYGWPKAIGEEAKLKPVRLSIKFEQNVSEDGPAAEGFSPAEGCPYTITDEVCQILPRPNQKSTHHLTGYEVSSRQHLVEYKDQASDYDGNKPTSSADLLNTSEAALQSNSSEKNMDNLQNKLCVQSQLPTLPIIQVSDNSGANHLGIQDENLTPLNKADKHLSMPHITHSDVSYSETDEFCKEDEELLLPAIEQSDRVCRKPVVPSLCPLRELVNMTSLNNTSKPADQYSLYFKYHSDKAIIDCSTYTKHARKPVNRTTRNSTDNDLNSRS